MLTTEYAPESVWPGVSGRRPLQEIDDERRGRPEIRLYPTPRNLLSALIDLPGGHCAVGFSDLDEYKSLIVRLKVYIDVGTGDKPVPDADWVDLRDDIEDLLQINLIPIRAPRQAYDDAALAAFFASISGRLDDNDGRSDPALTTDTSAADLAAENEQMAREISAMKPKPLVRVFDLDKYKTWLAGLGHIYDKDEAFRMSRIRKGMIENGGADRWLAELPEDWRDLLNEFEAGFPNLSPFIRFVHRHFALSARGDRRIELPPALLVGPPGVGKTEGLRWLAERLGIACKAIDMGSAQTASPLGGSERYWGNTKPGAVFEHTASSKYANPIFLLDEIDKTRAARHDPLSALYQLLESSSAKHFSDLSVPDLEFDASHVLWVASANSLDTIPAPILSRMAVFEIPEPTPEQATAIAKRIYRMMIAERHWGGAFATELDDCVARRLGDLPPRVIKKTIVQALGNAAIADRAEITTEDIDAALGSDRRASHAMGFLARPRP